MGEGRGMWTGVVIGALGVAVIALIVAVVVLAGEDENGDEGENVTATETVAERVLIAEPYGETEEEPAELIFSVNGDLRGENLEWQGWGEETASAAGTFVMRDGGVEIPVTGNVEVSDLTECEGSQYYTTADVTLGSEAPFQPGALGFGTPCD
ncbi:MAG: hypothetical protein ACXWDG_11295 [Aeromicrobium sp.]